MTRLEGADALTMRTLARELGVATMSLYRHVDSRETLLALMADHALAEEAPPRRAGTGWRPRLERLLRLQWSGYERRPWLATTISIARPQALRNGVRHTDAVLEAVSELGFDAATTLRTGIALVVYVRGMASSPQQERQAEQDTGLDREEWMQARDPTFAPFLASMPTLAKLAAEPDVDMSLESLFECGFTALLDGLLAQIQRRGSGR